MSRNCTHVYPVIDQYRLLSLKPVVRIYWAIYCHRMLFLVASCWSLGLGVIISLSLYVMYVCVQIYGYFLCARNVWNIVFVRSIRFGRPPKRPCTLFVWHFYITIRHVAAPGNVFVSGKRWLRTVASTENYSLRDLAQFLWTTTAPTVSDVVDFRTVPVIKSRGLHNFINRSFI